MNNIQFVWNSDKSTLNKKKHGVSFEEARTAFNDDCARIIYDTDHSEDEDRFLLLGLSERLRLLVVCHCYQEEESVIRIISARNATQNEHKQYMEQRS